MKIQFVKFPVPFNDESEKEKHVYINPLLVVSFVAVEEEYVNYSVEVKDEDGETTIIKLTEKCTMLRLFGGEQKIVACPPEKVQEQLNHSCS